ncbi:MAG: class I SAM-dependent methyltransferase [Chloroflexia bacterium]
MSSLREEYRDAARLDVRIRFHSDYSTNTQGLYRWILDQLDLAPQSRILDIGCGSGRLWVENHDRIPDGWQIVLADFSPGVAEDACKQLSRSPRRFAFAVCDVQALAFHAGSFDAVIANHMLYHVPNRAKAYAEIGRVLKPDGRLYATANSRNTMRVYDELIGKARSASAAYALTINDGNTVNGFNLEHGMEELAQAFPHVEMHRYEDALLIPDARPLVAYAEASGHLAGEQLGRFRSLVDELIEEHGPLRIGKNVGLFVAAAA